MTARPVTVRWRKPAPVRMVRWDGSDEAFRVIAMAGGQPRRATLLDGWLVVYVDTLRTLVTVEPGDWIVLEDPSGVTVCRAGDHDRLYGAQPVTVPGTEAGQ